MKSGKYLLLIVTLFTQLSGASWFQNEDPEIVEDEVYLSFRYQGVIDNIIVAYFDGERFYLPVTELFDHFGINYELNPAKYSVSGFFIKDNIKYVLDFDRRFAQFQDEVWMLDANDYKVKELDFYIAPAVFNKVFGLDIKVDLAQLTIKLETAHQLPIVTRYKRRHQRELKQKYSAENRNATYELLSDRQSRVLDGGLMDYSMYNTFSRSNQTVNLNIGVGGEVLYGDMQGNITASTSRYGNSFASRDIRWRYADQSSPWFSTVTLGQQRTIGLNSQTFQGVNVTNEPLVQKRSYDTYVIDGNTEPEAEVELFQDGLLVDVTAADDIGYYRFLVPLNYGVSDYKTRIYAKQGRIIESDRIIQIPFSFLPKKEVRYGINAGRIISEEKGWKDQETVFTGTANMGITNWLTAGLGIEYIEQSNQNRPVFYSRISSRIVNDILVNLDIAKDNFTKVTVRGVGPNASSISSEYSYYNKSSIYNTLLLKHRFSSNIFLPFQIGATRFSARGTIGWQNRAGENKYDLSTDVNQLLRHLRLRLGARESHIFSGEAHYISSEVQMGAVYTIPRLPRFHSLIRGSYFRLDLAYNTNNGLWDNMQFQFIKQLSSTLKFQSFYTYDFGNSNKSIDLGIVWDFDKFRSGVNLRSGRSTTSVSQSIRGSVAFDRNYGKMLWDNRQQVGRSGVSIRMFMDDDNSGTYDDGEEVIPGNALTIEGASSRQIKKDGVTRMTQLQAYRRYNFHVNEARVNNPMLVASKKDFSVIMDPNRYKQLDIPFYATGVIDGIVEKVQNGEFVPISGLRIHIVNEFNGFNETVRTFGDGAFYSMEIPPGDYVMWIDESQLEFLGMVSKPEKRYFTVHPSADGDFVEGLDFLLE
ncbi:MAG: hypothetical protein HQ507_04095 [Candidatus Marinimicrobia bacterium]|nr:hypothetical protein [Candidatus Neomarinimicrobiota bacterium]